MSINNVFRRPWLHPKYPHRAFDKNGNDVYFKRSPTRNHTSWGLVVSHNEINDHSLYKEAGFVDASIASEKWHFSRQSFEDYQTLINS